MADKIFVDGLRFDRPNEKAPEWVKGKLSIFADKLIPFIEKYRNERGYLNLDLKESKEGKLYLELNTFGMILPQEENNMQEVSNDRSIDL